MAAGFVSDPVQLPDGSLLVPVRIEDDTGVIGDTVQQLTPDDPQYALWLPFVQQPE